MSLRMDRHQQQKPALDKDTDEAGECRRTWTFESKRHAWREASFSSSRRNGFKTLCDVKPVIERTGYYTKFPSTINSLKALSENYRVMMEISGNKAKEFGGQLHKKRRRKKKVRILAKPECLRATIFYLKK